jgi:hypothetical protein
VGHALGLPSDSRAWAVFRDLVSGREGLRNCAALHDDGFAVSLHAYERRVLLDWRIVHDGDGAVGELAARIGWDGTVPSVDEALDGIRAEWRAALEPPVPPAPSVERATEGADASAPKRKPKPKPKPRPEPKPAPQPAVAPEPVAKPTATRRSTTKPKPSG